MSKVLDSLRVPIIAAPMAGGPTTPRLVNAVTSAGGFGVLAWGNSSRSAAQEQLAEVQRPFGVNLFYPQEPLDVGQLAAARAVAEAEGVELNAVDYTFGWEHKLELALAGGAQVVWSMFGCASTEEIQRIQSAGAEAWVTVTNEGEARAASARGVDVLCVQGPEAGGHRGVWDHAARPDERPLGELVAAMHEAVPDLPLIAAGGLRNAADVQRALAWPGVQAVSCGSAFLLCEEAGTSAANRQLIARGGDTVATRALSGRVARGLATDYTRAHPDMPPIYPHLAPILAARRAAGEPEVAYCLVGIRPDAIDGGSAEEVVAQLWGTGH